MRRVKTQPAGQPSPLRGQPEMPVSKVVYGDQTLIDLTQDSVTADTLLEGVTAHSAAGVVLVGTYKPSGGQGAPTALIGTFEKFDDWVGIVAAVDMGALVGTFEVEEET